jgi:parallel beta-helix repeat protein
VAVDPEHNTATAQEIIIASVKEDDDNETPYVYPQPEVIDTFTFPLKINPSPPDPSGTPITAPAVISSPGHYRLINDLSNSSAETAILITASDVVLDGNGHTLEGNGSPETSGVSIRGGSAGGSNVTVQGLTMSGWSRGIGVENQTGGVINTCNPTRNVFGIYVENSRGVQVTGVNASGNIPVNGGGGTGISIIESPGCVVTCSTASQNGWTAPLDIGGYGILLDSSPGTVISSCTMNGNRNTAIEDLSGPAGLLLEDNVISGNGGNGGIFFSTLRTIRTQNCTISRNRISGNGMGIGIDQADNCVMEQNQVTGGGNGIVLSSSRNATLAGNVMAGNIVNFQVTGTGEQYYQHVIGTSNTVNGKPVMYLFNQPGALVDAGSRAGTVYGIASPGITVRDLVLMNSSSGVFLLNSDNAVVQNVTALGNLIGISMNGCDNLTITGSTASGNDLAGCDIQDSDGGTFESVTADNTIDPHPDTGAGISIETSRDIHIANATTRMNKFAGIWVSDSDGIRITQATISGNGDAGIVITGDGTEVSGCRIVDNGQAGIGLLSAQRSRITNNWFSNKMNIYIGDDVAGTAWNTPKTLGTNIVNGPYLGGNYWANPEGTGFSQTHADRGDGFCNESYAINADNMDYLPLHTYSPKPTFYADFTVSPTSGMAPLTVKCTDKSVGNPTRYNYDFGDGVNVTGPNPTHTYRFPGTYSITLTITKYDKTTSSIIGTSTTKTNVISVGKVPFVMPVARFTASPVNGTVPLTVTFTDQSSGDPSFYNYDFGDGINATGKDQVHTYRYPGIYNVTLTVLKNDAANRMMVANSSVRTGLITVNGK